MPGIPFIVSAPSGAGKTTLCNMAVKHFKNLRYSISYTTRPARAGEKDGVDYRFTGDRAFDEMIGKKEFLEYASVHGKRYGTGRKDLEEMLSKGIDVILDIDVQGALSAKKALKDGVYIFILPPSIEECEQRLRVRGKDLPGEINKRLEIARREIKMATEYEYIIINDNLEESFEVLKSIITAERAKRHRMGVTLKTLFGL
jgi:guanylate kinase